MNLGLRVLAILTVCSAAIVLPRTAAADEWDKRTVLTFSQPVEIPGRVLPAGTYIFQLADSAANRHIVQVFTSDGRIIASFLTIPTIRRTPADDTRVAFQERRAGGAFPMKKWFYPGDLDGEEFIFHRHTN